MMSFWYRENGKVKQIVLNVEEYERMIKTTKLYSTREEARKHE